MMRFSLLLVLSLLAIVNHNQAADITDSAKFMLFYGSTFEVNDVIPFNNFPNVLQSPKYKANRPTVIYLHGYKGSPSGDVVQAVIKNYIHRDDHNVFVLDYSLLVNGDYTTAVLNARQLAVRFADVLQISSRVGLDLKKLHLVGHSLGAQVCGEAGRQLIQKTNPVQRVNRITGLDPAKMFFYILGYRTLDSADATFVDIVHSDAGGYGQPEAKGTVDFYPNGGKALQPDCPAGSYPAFSAEDLCSHNRAPLLYAESLLSPNFKAVLATSWTAFQQGQVNSLKTAYLGFNCATNTSPGIYFLTANGAPPFSRGDAGIP